MKNNEYPQRQYPWAENKPDPNRANYDDTHAGGTSPGGCFPGGQSPCGCQELSGNVFEWTRSLWGRKYNLEYEYPYGPEIKERENIDADSRITRVVRGGCFYSIEFDVRCSDRNYFTLPDFHLFNVGFRVVCFLVGWVVGWSRVLTVLLKIIKKY